MQHCHISQPNQRHAHGISPVYDAFLPCYLTLPHLPTFHHGRIQTMRTSKFRIRPHLPNQLDPFQKRTHQNGDLTAASLWSTCKGECGDSVEVETSAGWLGFDVVRSSSGDILRVCYLERRGHPPFASSRLVLITHIHELLINCVWIVHAT